jgi:3-phosphoshikimate 1-carboxyvinyltransferase
MIHAISEGTVRHGELSDAADSLLLEGLLNQLKNGSDRVLNTKDAGSVFRFLTAYLAITPGKWILHGDERMQERPVAPLVEALTDLGADIDYIGKEGYPPLEVRGRHLQGGSVKIDPAVSSQFVSALMMIGPMLKDGLVIGLSGNPVSVPYIFLTEHMMKIAGAELDIALPIIHIKGKQYSERLLPSEPDWSAAAPWYQLMAFAEEGELLLKDLAKDSMQGDSKLAKYFKTYGVHTEFSGNGALLKKVPVKEKFLELNLTATPDIAPGMIVTAAALGFDGYFTGLSTLKIKESDRLDALVKELGKANIKCSLYQDELSFEPQQMKISKPFETYNDHRLAMAFAPLVMLGNKVMIDNPGVVVKSYPGFWNEFHKVLGVGG